MKKIIIRILSIFMMVLTVVSVINLNVFAMTFEEKVEFNEKLPQFLKENLGESVPGANELNDLIDGELGYLVKLDSLDNEDIAYYRDFANNIFKVEENKKYLEENNYSNIAKYEVLNDWLWDKVTAGSLGYHCDNTCLNFVDCIVKGHREQMICQEVSRFNILVLSSIGISVAVEHSNYHVETYPYELLSSAQRWMPASTYRIDFVAGNILYKIYVNEDGSFNVEKKYAITHEHIYDNVEIVKDSTCGTLGERKLKCSVGDKEHDCYCDSFLTENIDKKPHTFNNKIKVKEFHAGEYSTIKNINNTADTDGELVNGKLTYTNCDGTAVSTDNYGGYYQDQPKLNIWGYHNTDQEGGLRTNNFHACEVAKVYKYVCDRAATAEDSYCDKEYKYEIVEPTKVVTYTDEVVNATCDKGGYVLRTCNLCNTTKKVADSETETLSCDFEGAEIIIEKEPTCDETYMGQGSGYQVCKNEGCQNKKYITLSERIKHTPVLLLFNSDNVDSYVNNTTEDVLEYAYIACSACNMKVNITVEDYPEFFNKYKDFCEFQDDGLVKVTFRASSKELENDSTDSNKDDISGFVPDSNKPEDTLTPEDNNNQEDTNINTDVNEDLFKDDDNDDSTIPVECSHQSVKYKVLKPTYFKEGKQDLYCTECGETFNSINIQKLTLKTPKFKLTKGKKQFKVKYAKVKDATGFQVRYKIKGKWKLKKFDTKKSATKVVKKLKKGKYQVQIRAYKLLNGQYAYSNWSRGKTVRVR